VVTQFPSRAAFFRRRLFSKTDRDMAVPDRSVKGLGRFLGAGPETQPEIAMFQIAITDKFNKL